ncbi:MAG: hypothetical protein WDA42_00810 [Candidatus Bathyarchaeia archaeon]
MPTAIRLFQGTSKTPELEFRIEQDLQPKKLWDLGVLRYSLTYTDLVQFAKKISKQLKMSLDLSKRAEWIYSFRYDTSKGVFLTISVGPYHLLIDCPIELINELATHLIDVEYARKWRVLSDSDPFITYEITYYSITDHYTCSCPAFVHGTTRPCKHIKRLVG